MIQDALDFWKSIQGKVRQAVTSMMTKAMQCERYDVTTAPNGTVIGVTKPLGGDEIFLKYSNEVANAVVGDTVLVVWWGSLSNARVWCYGSGLKMDDTSKLPLTGGTVTGDLNITGNVTGRVLGLGQAIEQIPSGANLNNYTTPGVYGILSSSVAATIVNNPSKRGASTFRVWNGRGDGRSISDDGGMIMQEVSDAYGCSWRRKAQNSSGTISWSSWQTDIVLGQSPNSIDANADLNDYMIPGVYNVGSSANAQTISHMPVANPGTLRVWNALGDGNPPTGVRYHITIQQYFDSFGTSWIRRCVENPVGTFAWTAWTTPLVLGGPNNTIPDNSDLNDYVRPGVYGITTNNTAASLAHCPTTSAGTLRVWNALGSSANPGDTWYYVVQEYTTAYTDTWRRCGETGSGTTVTWGAWSYYAGQLSVLKSYLGLGSSVAFDYKSAANGGSVSWTFGRAERGAVIVASASSNGHDIILYNNSASNSTSTTRIRNATGITVTGSGGTLTIANSTGVFIYALRISWV